MAIRKQVSVTVLVSLFAVTVAAHALYQAHAGNGTGPYPDALRPYPARLSEPAVVVAAEGGPVQLHTSVDRTAVLRGGDGRVHVEVRVKTDKPPGDTPRVPTDVIVVLDRSGSMSGEKLEYAKSALRGLVQRLRPVDRFGLVTYESSAELRLPLAHPSAAQARVWSRAIDELSVAGGTNMSAGLDLGLEMLERPSDSERPVRMLLLSDGLANEGDPTLAGLTRRAERAVAAGSVLSTLGIGNDFDERVMTALSTHGTGAFYYLSKLEYLQEFLDAELKTASETYAQQAELVVQVAPGIVVSNASGVPLDRRGDQVFIPLGSLYSAHERKLWLTLQVPNAELREHELGTVAVRYRRAGTPFEVPGATLPQVACVTDSDLFRKRIDRDVWERAMLEEELNGAREALGDAIASGSAADVDRTLQRVEERRVLAETLGSQRVLEKTEEFRGHAAQAKAAQVADAAARNIAAKREKAIGYTGRNRSQYAVDSLGSF